MAIFSLGTWRYFCRSLAVLREQQMILAALALISANCRSPASIVCGVCPCGKALKITSWTVTTVGTAGGGSQGAGAGHVIDIGVLEDGGGPAAKPIVARGEIPRVEAGKTFVEIEQPPVGIQDRKSTRL